MYRLPFVKMSATGNDFIMINAADCRDVDPGWLARRLCARAFSVGADGLIVVAGTRPSGVLAGIESRWAAVTLDGARSTVSGIGGAGPALSHIKYPSNGDQDESCDS